MMTVDKYLFEKEKEKEKFLRNTSVSSLPAIMYRKISWGVKLAAIHLHEHQLLSLENILACVGFSESTFWRILKLWRETSDIVSISNRIRGRPRVLQCDDVLYLIRLVRHRPEWFLDELLVLLDTNHFVSVHYATIHHELERVGVSSKNSNRLRRKEMSSGGWR
jgi:transposase